MKTKIKLTGIMLLSIIVLAAFAVSCKPKKSAETVSDFNIYGVWRYTGSADVEHGETWRSDNLDLISLYDDGGTCLVTYRNSLYYGTINETGDNWYQFNAITRMDSNGETYNVEGQGPYTFLFGYDPETGRLIERDETVENYFEWVSEYTAAFVLTGTKTAGTTPAVQIRYATSEDSFEIVNTYEYDDTDRDGSKYVVMWADITVRDFDFISTGYDYEADSMTAGSVLYSINEFPPGKMFLVHFILIGDGIPVRGISYSDENNTKRYFYIGESGIDGLLSLVEFQNKPRSFVTNAEFNNQTIPMTVYYSPLPYGGYYLNSLEFMYDGAKQTVHIIDGKEMMPFFDFNPDTFGGGFLQNDYNFDGYADIAVFTQSGYGANEWYDIYLYNPRTKSYYRHEELSGMCGVRADTETKTVKSSGRTSFYGYAFYEYKWENGELTLIYSEIQDAVDLLYDSDLLFRTTGTLRNGSWTEQTEYFRYDSDGNEIRVEIMG